MFEIDSEIGEANAACVVTLPSFECKECIKCAAGMKIQKTETIRKFHTTDFKLDKLSES